MAINAQFPDWLRQDTRDAQAAGIAIGRNMLEGLKLREEQRQFDQTQPLRQAQVLAQQAQAQSFNNRAKLEALSLDQKQKELGSMADAMAFESDIAGSENGYSNPESRARFYSFVSERPWLADSPWAVSMNKKFEVSDSLALKSEELRAKLAQSEAMNQFREDAAKNSSERLRMAEDALALKTKESEEKKVQEELEKKTDEELRALGWDEDKISTFRSTQTGGYKIRQANEYVKNTEKAMAPFGVVLYDARKAELRSKYIAGAQATLAPPDIVKAVNSEASAFNRLDTVVKDISDFNTKYGANAFDDYVGPIDNPVFRWKSQAIAPKDTKAADKAARDIFRRANFIIQSYRNKQFGTALTEGETAAFRQIVSDPGFADYSNGLGSFRDSMKASVGESLEAYELAPNIPTRWKAEFLYKTPSGTVSETVTPTGQEPVRIRVDPSKLR